MKKYESVVEKLNKKLLKWNFRVEDVEEIDKNIKWLKQSGFEEEARKLFEPISRKAWFWAADHGKLEVVNALWEKKLIKDVDLKDEDGNTALMCASCCGEKEVVEALLAKGAGVNIRNEKIDNQTALSLACKTAEVNVVEILLKNGAYVSQKAKEEVETGWDYFANYGLRPDWNKVCLYEGILRMLNAYETIQKNPKMFNEIQKKVNPLIGKFRGRELRKLYRGKDGKGEINEKKLTKFRAVMGAVRKGKRIGIGNLLEK